MGEEGECGCLDWGGGADHHQCPHQCVELAESAIFGGFGREIGVQLWSGIEHGKERKEKLIEEVLFRRKDCRCALGGYNGTRAFCLPSWLEVIHTDSNVFVVFACSTLIRHAAQAG